MDERESVYIVSRHINTSCSCHPEWEVEIDLVTFCEHEAEARVREIDARSKEYATMSGPHIISVGSTGEGSCQVS